MNTATLTTLGVTYEEAGLPSVRISSIFTFLWTVLLFFGGLFTCLSVPEVRAQIVADGSFETPVVPWEDNSYDLSILLQSPWTFSWRAYILHGYWKMNGPSGLPNGSQVAVVQHWNGNSAFSQTITLPQSGLYKLTYYDAGRQVYSPNYGGKVLDGNLNYEVVLDNTVITTASTHTYQLYTRRQVLFSAEEGAHLLTFRSIDTSDDHTGFFDAIAISPYSARISVTGPDRNPLPDNKLRFTEAPIILATPQTKSLIIKNTGDEPLNVGPISISGPNASAFIYLFPSSIPLAPGEERGMGVTFDWLSLKKQTAILSISRIVQDPNPIVIVLEGGGIDIKPTELNIVPYGVHLKYNISGGNMGAPATVKLYWADGDFPIEAEDIPPGINFPPVLAHSQALQSTTEGDHIETFYRSDFTAEQFSSKELSYLGCKIVADDMNKKNNLLSSRMTITASQMRSYLNWHNAQRSLGHPEADDFRKIISLQLLIDRSLANTWDPRFILGIAGAESIFGSNDWPPYKPLPGPYNYWGLKDVNHEWMHFDDWSAAVTEAASRPSAPVYNDSTKVSEFALIYTETDQTDWNETVFGVMQSLGYPSTDDTATRVAGSAYFLNWGSAFFRTYSPVSLYLVDPAGRRIGRALDGSEYFNDIPQATMEMTDDRVSGIVLPAFLNGSYGLYVVGTGTGSYRLEAIFTDRLGQFGGEIKTFPIELNGLHIFAINVVANNAESAVVNQTYADSDGDAIPDERDAFPLSIMSPTVIIDNCDTGIQNHILSNGSTFADMTSEVGRYTLTHGQFVKTIAKLTQSWRDQGLISGEEKGAIEACAAKSTVPPLAGRGDVDDDGDVDRDDLAIITAALNKPALGPHDSRDLDGDGKITVLDARKLVTLFTRPGGATK